MNIIDLIINSNEETLEEFIKNNPTIELNEPIKGITPLYSAITGGKLSMQKKTGKGGKLEIVKLLLQNGANPNKKSTLQPPVYTAVVEKNFRILSLLLMFGANPNTYCLKKISKDDNGKLKHCECIIPLVLAINNFDFESFEILINNNAVFSKETIKIAKRKKNKTEIWLKKYNNACDERDKLRKILKYSVDLKKMIKIMETQYNENYENKVDEFIEQNKKTGSYPNNFPGFRKIS
jgi:hypothetical protein